MKHLNKCILALFCCASWINRFTQDSKQVVFPGADEKTPFRSQYFSWINNTNEGSTEAQTINNLAFFKWLNDEYGMA